MKNKKGFTLLEIIVVIIIIAVLAALALPRLTSTVDYSRNVEATRAFQAIRGSMERCGLRESNDFDECDTFTVLDIDDPTSAAGSDFTFGIAGGVNTYFLSATWKSGVPADKVTLDNDGTNITLTGAGIFTGL